MIIKEGRKTGEFLKSEGADGISRDTVTLAKHSLTYQSGAVLAQVTISRNFTHLNPSATDGSQIAKAVLYQERSAIADPVKGLAIARLAQVKAPLLVWPEGITANQKQAAVDQLDARGIIVRS